MTIIYSNRTRYTVLLLFALAERSPKHFYTIDSLAEDTGMSESYLRKIIKTLAKTPYLETRKGPSGGVRMSKQARRRKLSSCLVDIGGFNVETLANRNTRHYRRERGFSLWCIQQFMDRVLGSLTLQESAELATRLTDGAQTVQGDVEPESKQAGPFRSLSELDLPPPESETEEAEDPLDRWSSSND